MDAIKYSVRVNRKDGSTKYIVWCDDCWYETGHRDECRFTKEQAETICKQMEKHYVHNMTIIGSDGSTYERGFKNPNKSIQPAVEQEEQPVKKSIFKLSRVTIRR